MNLELLLNQSLLDIRDDSGGRSFEIIDKNFKLFKPEFILIGIRKMLDEGLNYYISFKFKDLEGERSIGYCHKKDELFEKIMENQVANYVKLLKEKYPVKTEKDFKLYYETNLKSVYYFN